MATLIDRSTTRTRDSQAPAKIEAQLRALARGFDPELRRAFARRQLAKLAQRPLTPRAIGKPPHPWLPALPAVLAALVVPNMVEAVWPTTPGPLFLALTITVLVITDLWLWPMLFLAGFRFRLMRAESAGESGVRYLAARIGGSRSGFDEVTWPSLGTVAPGDLVVGVSRRLGDQPAAVIHLAAAGRQGVSSLTRQLHQPATLPAAPRHIKKLAAHFDDACERYRQLARTTLPHRPLRSSGQGGDDPWASVVLDEPIKRQLTGLAEHFAKGSAAASRGLLLHGPPGTGKTLIARAIAASINAAFYPVSLPDLQQEWLGASTQRTRELWQRALAQPRAVLFIDECDSVFSRRSPVRVPNTYEVLQTFLAEWDGFGKQSTVWVIGATNRRDTIDPAILSRFGEEVEIPLPSTATRVEILRRELQQRGAETTLPLAAGEFTQGMSGRDLATLAGRIIRNLPDGQPLSDTALAEQTTHWRKQASVHVDAQATWETLVLADETIAGLKSIAAVLSHADRFAQRGIAVPRGILLHGPPGTGKTQIARTLANETGLHFLAATTADIKAGYLGQSGQQVQAFFERAREAAPAILFLDELDIIAPVRGSHPDAFAQEIIGQLLQELDGAQASPQHVFVLAATNRVDQVDAAILSRLPKRIAIPLPDEAARQRLLKVLLIRKPLACPLAELAADLAQRSSGLSGRDLRSWIERAEQKAVARALAAGEPDAVTLVPDDFAGP